jgi:putative flippase GtrA
LALMQALRYAAVGVANTAIDFGIFFALIALSVPVWQANSLSWAVSFASAYPLNAIFTFRAPHLCAGSLLRFVLVSVAGLLAGTATVTIAYTAVPLIAAKVCAIGVSFVATFLLHRVWTFRVPA